MSDYREEVAQQFYKNSYKNLKDWEKAEIISAEWFRRQKCKVEVMQRCNRGFDLLINERIRVDVKYTDGKARSQKTADILSRTELEFGIRKRQKVVKTTDFYLLVFYQRREEKVKLAGYLISYEDMPNINELTIHRYKIKDWITSNELSTKTLRKNGIYKFGRSTKTKTAA